MTNKFKELLEEKSKLEKWLMEVNEELNIIKQNEEEEIKRKDSLKNKTKLSQLTSNDNVFKVTYNRWRKEITWAGYIDVIYCGYDEDNDCYDFSTKHKTKPEGFSTAFPTKYGEKHCVLLDCDSTLYFITMKPQTWEQDMEESLKEYLATQKEYYDKDVENIKKHVGLMVKNYKLYQKDSNI